jgi:ethanolamine utilization cobalamin adenosyltransferase
VFRNSRRFNRKVFNKAVQASDIVGFNYRNLHHCTNNNIRLAANDHLVIKKASGAKTDSAFKKYNLVTEQEKKSIKWLDEKSANFENIDTCLNANTISEIAVIALII